MKLEPTSNWRDERSRIVCKSEGAVRALFLHFMDRQQQLPRYQDICKVICEFGKWKSSWASADHPLNRTARSPQLNIALTKIKSLTSRLERWHSESFGSELSILARIMYYLLSLFSSVCLNFGIFQIQKQ